MRSTNPTDRAMPTGHATAPELAFVSSEAEATFRAMRPLNKRLANAKGAEKREVEAEMQRLRDEWWEATKGTFAAIRARMP